MSVQSLERELFVPQPIEEVFAFFADAANLERITPAHLRFEILTPLPITMRAGTLIDYRLRLMGLAFHWRTRIDLWDPPHRFIDTQLRGPYREWVHTHSFAREGRGTRMRDAVHYQLPLAPWSDLALPWVRRRVRQIFDHRARVIAALFDATP